MSSFDTSGFCAGVSALGASEKAPHPSSPPEAGAAGAAARARLAAALRGMPLAEARAEERRRAFEQYAALPESFFANMREAAGLKPRAKL